MGPAAPRRFLTRDLLDVGLDPRESCGLPPTPSGSFRIVTLNLQHGGRPRIAKLAARLLGYNAEVLVLTEFQQENSATLVQSLEAAGYGVAHPAGVDPTLNTVAIASRQPITGVRPLSSALDPRHLLCAETAGIRLCAAYLPVPTEVRVPHLEALIAEVGIGEVYRGEVGIGEVGVGEVRVVEVHPVVVRPGEGRPGEGRGVEERKLEVLAGEVLTGEVRRVEPRPAEVRAGEVRAKEARTGEVR